jgi:hypothetical protein
MVVTVALGLIVTALMVIPVLVAVLIGFHRVMIVRSILRADQRRGDAGHCDGGECEQCRLPKVLTHGEILIHGWSAHARRPLKTRKVPPATTPCRCQPTQVRQKYPSNRIMA